LCEAVTAKFDLDFPIDCADWKVKIEFAFEIAAWLLVML